MPDRARRLPGFATALAAWVAAGSVFGQAADRPPVGGGLRERLGETEFVFSRSRSDVPFPPVLTVGATAYGASAFQRADADGATIEYRSTAVGGYAMLPLHVGRRSLVLAVPYASLTRFTSLSDGEPDADVSSFHLPLGGAWQANSGRQYGGFAMPSIHSPLAEGGDGAADLMAGVFGRQFSDDRSTWYYGLVYDYSFGAHRVYPYLGYTFQLSPQWLFSLVAPWPSVAYAPSSRLLVQAGVLPSGATWAISEGDRGNRATMSIGGWDLGLLCNWRLGRLLWLGAGAGVSGLRSLHVDEGGDVRFEQELSREPYARLSLSVRPG